ncbi:MAG: TetR/AcrR family transcriptional regulator [Myxococcota bacterium]
MTPPPPARPRSRSETPARRIRGAEPADPAKPSAGARPAKRAAGARPGTRSARGPGRPAAGSDAPDLRAALLDAARAEFGARSFAAVTLRGVAQRAGTTAAMVHYYFGDKHGLFGALLESALQSVLARASAALATRVSQGAGPASVDVLLDVVHDALGAAPWIPQMIVREVFGDDAPFRERFVEGYARPMSQLVRRALRAEVAVGRLRDDLDVDLALVSLLGLVAFPFIAKPVLERVLGFAYDGAFRARLAAHTKRLFLEGAKA